MNFCITGCYKNEYMLAAPLTLEVKPLPPPSGIFYYMDFQYDDSRIDRLKREILRINRNAKIDALINGVEYKEMKLEDHPDWFAGF